MKTREWASSSIANKERIQQIEREKEEYRRQEQEKRNNGFSAQNFPNAFEIADSVIEHVYPDFNERGKGWWGDKMIPNWGILRGSIVSAIEEDHKGKFEIRRKR